MSPSPGAPEQKARAQIGAALIAAGWIVQDRDAMNRSAGLRGRQVIENYPDDAPYPSALAVSFARDRPVHAVGSVSV